MGLLIFAVVFILCNIGLYVYSKVILKESNYTNFNNIKFIRGDVRGYTLRIDSDDSLERRRADLNKRNSKF